MKKKVWESKWFSRLLQIYGFITTFIYLRIKYMLIPVFGMIITCIISEIVYGVPAFAYVITVALALVLCHILWFLAFLIPIKFLDWVCEKLK